MKNKNIKKDDEVFSPGDKVFLTYRNSTVLGEVKYQVTKENCKGNKKLIGCYVVHSPGMSSTLPASELRRAE